MIRNLKVLGLAVVSVLALSAVVASAAMAVTPQVEVGTGDGRLIGTQTVPNIFTVAGGRTVTCEKVVLNGALGATSTTVTATPTYSECHSVLAGVKIPATVTSAGCSLLLHLGATTEPPGTYTATADLVCEGTKDVEIHVYPEGTKTTEHETKTPLCRYTIKPQNGLGSLTAVNNATDVTGTLNVSKIKYTRTTGTIANCGAAEGEGTLKGQGTITGQETAPNTGALNVQIVEV